MRAVRVTAKVIGWTVLVVVLLALSTVLTALVAARTDWGHKKILAVALPQIRKQLAGRLTIGRLGGDMTHNLVLYDVELDDVEHRPAVRVRRLEVHYDLLSLARHEIDLTKLEADGAWVHARTLRDGKLNLTELARPAPQREQQKQQGAAYQIRVGKLVADVTARYDAPASDTAPARSYEGEAHLEAHARVDGGDVDVGIASLTARTRAPLVATLEAHGGARVHDGAVSADHLTVSLRSDGEELRKLAPEVALRGRWRVRLDANGPADKLAVALVAEPPAGRLAVDAELRTQASPAHASSSRASSSSGASSSRASPSSASSLAALRWRATVKARGLDPAAAVAGAPRGDVRLDARGQGRGERGDIDLEQLVADVAGAHVAAHGTLDTAGDANLAAEVAARDLSRLRTVGVRGLAGRLDAKARLERTSTHLHVDADVSGQRLAFGANRVGALTAHVHDHDFVGEAHVRARAVKAGGVALDTVTLDASGAPRAVTLSLQARGPSQTEVALAAHGTPTTARHAGGVGGVKLTGADLTVDQLKVARFGQTWSATAPAQVRIHDGVAVEHLELASGHQRLGLDGSYGARDGALAGTLRADRLDLAALAKLARPAADLPTTSLAIEASVHGTRRAPVADLKLSGWSERTPLVANRIHYHVDAHYAGERVRANATLEAINQSVKARLDLPTRLGPRRPLFVDLAARGVDVQKLKRLLPPALAATQGRLEGSVKLSGTTSRPELALLLHGHHLDLTPDAKNSDLVVKLDYKARRLDARIDLRLLRSLAGKDAGALTAQLALPIDLSADQLQRTRRLVERLEHKTPIAAVVTLRGLDLGRFPFAELGVRPPLSGGTLDGSLKLRGTLHQPVLDVDVEGHALKRGKLDRIEAVASLDYANARGTLSLDASLRGQPLLRVRGRTQLDVRRILDHEPWKQAPLEVDATVPDYDLALLSDLVPKLAGRLQASATVRGTLAHPTGKLDASVPALQLAAMRYDRFAAHGAFDGALTTARLDAHEVKGGSLALSARVPVRAAAPLDASLKAQGFYVDVENTGLGSLHRLKGTLEAALDVHGPRANPTASGYLRFKDGVVAVAAEPRQLEGVQLDVAIADGTLTLKDLEAKIGDGSLKAHGTATLAGIRPEAVQLAASAHKFPIPTGTFGAWLDADVSLHGQRTPEGMSGTLTVEKGTANLPKIAGGRKLQKTGPLEDVKFVDAAARRAEARRKQAESSPPTAELVAHIPGPFHVRSKELMTDLKGNLRVEISGPVARIVGHVESTGGWLELLGRRYNIEKARVGFGGNAEPDPELDVRLTRQLSETMLVIEVHGTAKKPQLVLASDPPIYDQSEVIAAILSGDPATQRVDDRSLDQKVTGAVSSLVVGKIKDQIAPNLPIDVIKVDTGTEGATGLADTRVEIGKYITDTIYVSYVHQFGSTLVGTERRNSNEADLEWRFKKHYEVETAFGDAAVGRLNFYWTIRY